jgi:transcriptional regulator with PAS, ATPase and Fis domain
MQLVLSYPWPGNVRELKNTVERVVVTCPDEKVDVARLPSRVRDITGEVDSFTLKLGASLEVVERELIEKTLGQVTTNRKKAADILGISVRALQYKIKKYNLR